MPVIKSSKKRVLQTVKKTARNARLKKAIREASQAFEASLASGKKEVADTQSKLSSLLDKAAKKNVFHKNKAARRKASMAKMAKKAALAQKTPPKKTSRKA